MKASWFFFAFLCTLGVSIETVLEPNNVVDEKVLQCLENKYTSNSCFKVFCAPWQRCVDGRCVCKLPYQCPQNGTTFVCTESGRQFKNYCHLKSAECSNTLHKFSSAAPCNVADKFEISLTNKKSDSTGTVKVKVPSLENYSYLCSEGWSIKEANVACKQLNFPKGANPSFKNEELTASEGENCLKVTCQGLENSLMECTLKKDKSNGNKRAGVDCYTEDKECNKDEFSCVNGKCIPSSKSCDGENDCGDLSDELCCPTCKHGFHCKSDTCIPLQYKCNGELDCITGEDELNCTVPISENTKQQEKHNDQNPEHEQDDAVNFDTNKERKLLRQSLPRLSCGVPKRAARQKRIIGGTKAAKNQFPWQVAIKDGTQVNCGGIYIGGCWVLTAAHCVRENQPQKYRVIVELLDRLAYGSNIDSFPVKSVKVHEFYDPNTYENDIALLEVLNIYQEEACMQADNNLVPACLPWSQYQFKAGDTCTVSGWGRAEGLKKVFQLMWGHVNLMDNCTSVYKERFLDKMECAGTYDGSIDACKGDSGGPLVCIDDNNVAYLWGIVSWGENCGVAGYPGVYTKVARYFEWISRKVGRALVSQYNI